MSFISRLWERIRRDPTVVQAAFRIPAERVIGSSSADQQFHADEAYFELRLAEQFLQNRREYHQEFIPMTLLLSDFIYSGKRQSFPFVVGPSLLQELEQLDGDEQVRYRNTRVAGPIPYRGDDVNVFVGLFRVKTKNWAKQSLSLLESVAKAFDTSKLTSFINVTGPLVDSIESFLGIGEDMQFRIGERDSYTDPASNNEATLFRAGFFVMIRSDRDDIDESQFWVKENQLFHGPDKDQLELYRRKDYILLYINRLQIRNDHTTFDFHKEWIKAQDQLWAEDPNGARKHLRELTRLIQQSPDLIPSHRKALISMYRKKYKEEMELASMGLETLELSRGTQKRSISPTRSLISESDIQHILASPDSIEEVDLDENKVQ